MAKGNKNPSGNINDDERLKQQKEKDIKLAKAYKGKAPKMRCMGACKRNLSINNNFYSVNKNSGIQKDWAEGLVPICKSCIKEKCTLPSGLPDMDGIKWACKWFDIPFIESIVLDYMAIGKWDIGNYKGNLVLTEYKDWVYEDGLRLEKEIEENNKKLQQNKSVIKKEVTMKKLVSKEEVIAKNDEKKDSEINNKVFNFDEEESDFEVTREIVLFWGKGFNKEEYEFLESEYSNLTHRFECDSYSQEMLFQEISHQRLDIKKKRQSGASVDKELKTLQDLLGSANIKPVQETGANSAEQSTYGVLIKKWENEKPIPEAEGEWADVDGIKKYVNTFFFGHLCKMMNIRNDYTEQYEKEMAEYRVEVPEYEDGDE